MTAAAVASKARIHWSPELVEALEKAIETYDLPSSDAWEPLGALSENTIFEGFDVDPDSTVLVDGSFHAPGTVYVTLSYDRHSDKPVEVSDAYPMTVHFTVADHQVEIQAIEVDTSSFYE